MELTTTKRGGHLHLLILFLLGLSPLQSAISQTTIIADSLVDSQNTTNVQLATDNNMSTFAEIEAYSGALLGVGAYSGFAEIAFDTLVPANQTVYIRFEVEDNILTPLMAGSAGDFLATALGYSLTGNQSFQVEVKENSNVLMTANSSNPNDFTGENMKIVIDQYDNTYIAITPTSDFNCIRITNQLGALIGASTTKWLRLYSAHYTIDPPLCNTPAYTSYDTEGFTLDAIQLGGAGATNASRTIDTDLNSYSELSLGTISLGGASIEQKVYYEGLSTVGDQFGIRFRVPAQLGVLNLDTNISIRAQNGAIVVLDQNLGSLLTQAMSDSLMNGDVVTIYITPILPVDRIILHFDELIGVNLAQYINFHEVFKIPPAPVFNVQGSSTTVCEGETANVIVDASDPAMDINWYSDSSLQNLVGTNGSGQTFNTGALTQDTTFYATGFFPGCPDETNWIPVDITVLDAPDSNDVFLNPQPLEFCASETVTITPGSSIGNQFQWFFDAQSTQPINSGTVNGVTYTVQPNGQLVITGLDDTNSPYSFYVAVQDQNTLCWSAAGDLTQANIIINDTPPPTTSDSIQSFCLSDNPTIDDLIVTGTGITWYDDQGTEVVSGTALNDGNTYYATQQGGICESSDSLSVMAIIVTSDSVEILGATQSLCTSDTVTYTTASGMINYDWNVSGGLILDGGTASDDFITIIWQTSGNNTITVSYETNSGCIVSMNEVQNVEVNPCSGPDLELIKTVDNPAPFAGETVTFTITVINNGTAQYNNIDVSEPLPSGYTYVSHSTTSGMYDPVTGNWNIPYVDSAATEVLTIEVIVNSEGDYLNVAAIISTIPNDVAPWNNTDSMEVNMNCLTIYNQLTPNGDNLNDYFSIECIEHYPNNSVQIFNRFGNLLYTTENYQNDWDGIANVNGVIGTGNPIPNGTYFYVVTLEDYNIEKAGWLYILR